MIVFAAIVPHSPLLVPSIGKEHREKLSATLQAYATLEEQFCQAAPETLLIISPHGPMYPDAFSGHMAQEYTGVLTEFGDHGTQVKAKVDFFLLDRIHRAMRLQNVPFTLTNEQKLDYGFTVPLLLLATRLPKLRLVPISTSLLPPEAHVQFGVELTQVVHAESARVAVIASADLSHHAFAEAPEGAAAEGQALDANIRKSVLQRDVDALTHADPVMIETAGQCGYKPILTILGMLKEINVTPKELCYEAPFGVGYSTVSFTFA